MLPLEDALADLRITGAVLLHERYNGPIVVAVPDERKLRTLLDKGPRTKVVPFHLVTKGGFDLVTAEGRSSVGLGNVAICLDGMAHQLQIGRAAKATSLEAILAGDYKPPATGSDVESTELICGVFTMNAAPLNPLLAALPAVLQQSTSTGQAPALLAYAAEMLALELSTPSRRDACFTRDRLLEIFFAETIRSYQASASTLPVGWLKGLNDAKVAAALFGFHKAPGKAWSVEGLADLAALSPSRFAARFRDALGITAMEYVTRWRLNIACRLLTDSDDSLEAIAHAVGYGGAAAFSRSFKEHLGRSPAKWRESNTYDARARA